MAENEKMDNWGVGSRICVPGAGLPIDHRLRTGCFSAPLGSPDRATQREIDMVRMINEITDKTGWTSKVSNEEIVSKWRREASGMTEAMFQWCIQELRDKASIYESCQMIRVLDIQTSIVKSDSVIPLDLQQTLSELCANLLDANEADRDWHPRSDNKVLNLVHPSLYPLVYGKTRHLPSGRIDLENTMSSFGLGDICKVTLRASTPEPEMFGRRLEASKWSNWFVWLPCDVSWNEDGSVRIASYINNLHPAKFKALYPVIETFIAKSVPLWEACMRVDFDDAPKRIECDEALYEPPHPYQNVEGFASEYAEPEGLKYWVRSLLEDISEWDYDAEKAIAELQDDQLMAHFDYHPSMLAEHIWKHKRVLKIPDPEDYESTEKPWLIYGASQPEAERSTKRLRTSSDGDALHMRHKSPGDSDDDELEGQINLRKSFPQGLQVIVKLSSIELGPR